MGVLNVRTNSPLPCERLIAIADQVIGGVKADRQRITSSQAPAAAWSECAAGIGLNLRRGGASSTDDQTEGDAMSEATQRYHVFETAMGFCAIAWSEAGVA